MGDLRLTTRVAAAASAVGLKRPATAVRSVESRGTLAKGVVTPANRSSVSVSAPIANSPSVAAARPASYLPPAVYAAWSAISHPVYVVKTAKNRTVEIAVQGVYRE